MPEQGDFQVAVEGVSIWFAPADAVKLLRMEIDHDGSKDGQGFVVKEHSTTC